MAFVQPSFIDVVLWPGVLFLLGLGLWVFGVHHENDDGAAWIKWLAFIPLVIGVVVGWGWLSRYIDPGATGLMYRDEVVPGGRMKIAHYAAFGLPALTLVGILGWYLIDRRNR